MMKEWATSKDDNEMKLTPEQCSYVITGHS